MMSNIDSLIDLMSKLRDPVQGCPWDLKQSIASLLPHTLEEVYEVADAIESGSMVGRVGGFAFSDCVLCAISTRRRKF